MEPMATWIVHLRVAEKLLQKIEGLDTPLFAIGSITPDSGMPDEKWEKFDPPYEVTHFVSGTDSDPLSADLTFYRQYLAPWREEIPDQPGFSFRLGYFCHLLTDNLWKLDIGKPTLDSHIAEFEADKDFWWTVKKDWYGLDFLYLRDHPHSLYWEVFLKCSYARQDLPFLRLDGVQERIRYIQEYYRSKSNEELEEIAARPFEYLNQQQMDHFVNISVERIHAIYQKLWVQGEDAGTKNSEVL
jgi:hypothetical protein